jgi:eukaryotic-like serine/threonine-protein kinase
MAQPAEQDPLLGKSVGNYEVREKLGEGGMGAVYLAEHPRIGKKVALKVLHAEFAANEEVVERFFNEAKAVNDIQHRNIVDIIDFGELSDEAGGRMVYFIMEFLDGLALNKLIRREAPLPALRALHIASQISDALAASHRNQIVHRDLKPDNVVLLQRQGEQDFVKVLDFGIAKLTGDQQISHRTRTGMVMGTPAYMSPEQCEGKGRIDHRTDIYALGILLYEMLTGRVPFQGEGYGEVLVQHLTQLPQRPATVNPAIDAYVEAVVMKALEKRPDDRFPTMDELRQALQDPRAFIEARGGLQAFSGAWASGAAPGAPTRVLDPSSSQPYVAPPAGTPYPGQQVQATPYPGVQVTPYPAHGMTPAPGQVSPVTPYPGVTSPPGPAHGSMTAAQGKGGLGRPLVIGLAALGALLVGGGAFMLFTGGSEPAAEVLPPDAAAVAEVEEPPDAGVALGEAPPDAAPAPVEPQKVVISITSRPDGAAIFLGDATEPVGTTPYDLEVERGERPVPFRLERQGFETRSQTFVPNMARAIDLQLTRRQQTRPADTRPRQDTRPQPREPELDPDVFANPFGN